MTGPSPIPSSEPRTLGEILHEARVAGGQQRPRPWPPKAWADRDRELRALDEAMAAAVEAAVLKRLCAGGSLDRLVYRTYLACLSGRRELPEITGDDWDQLPEWMRKACGRVGETAAEAATAELRSRLADADDAIGQVIRLAESWEMQGGVIDVEHVARVLLETLKAWTGDQERTEEKGTKP